MAISGAGDRPLVGNSGQPAVDPASANQQPGTTAPSAAVAGTEAPKWAAGSQPQRPPVDLTLPPNAVSVADRQATMPNPLKQTIQNNVESYTRRLELVLNHDAASVARGKTPIREGDVITLAQLNDLQEAARDMLKDVPLGALSPALASKIERQLRERGLEPKDMQSTRLADVGEVGREIARDAVKDYIGDLHKSSPTAYYSLAASLGALVGISAWQGSAKLSHLGIKPEASKSFFNDHLDVKVAAEWQAKFKDLSASTEVVAHTGVGTYGSVGASVTANSRTGLDLIGVSANYNDGKTLAANAYVTANKDGVQDVGGSVIYKPQPNFTLSATANQNVQTKRTTATAEVAYEVAPNVDLALSASHDSSGESRVGVGVRIGF